MIMEPRHSSLFFISFLSGSVWGSIICLWDIITFDLSETVSSFQNVPFSAVREACCSKESVSASWICTWRLSFQNVCSCRILSFNAMCFFPLIIWREMSFQTRSPPLCAGRNIRTSQPQGPEKRHYITLHRTNYIQKHNNCVKQCKQIIMTRSRLTLDMIPSNLFSQGLWIQTDNASVLQ